MDSFKIPKFLHIQAYSLISQNFLNYGYLSEIGLVFALYSSSGLFPTLSWIPSTSSDKKSLQVTAIFSPSGVFGKSQEAQYRENCYIT